MPTVTWKKYGDIKDGDHFRIKIGGNLFKKTKDGWLKLRDDKIVFVDDPDTQNKPKPLPTYIPDNVYATPWISDGSNVVDAQGLVLSNAHINDSVQELIAAAPELYNVVKNVEVHLSSLALEDDDIVASQILALARQTIAKAECKDVPEVAAKAKPDANETKPKKTKTEYRCVCISVDKRMFENFCDSYYASEWVALGGVSIAYDTTKQKMIYSQAFTRTVEEE